MALAFKTHNPYTRIRQQAEEIAAYKGHMESFDVFKKKAENTIKCANMDIHLLMTIIKDIRPFVYPGALDNIVRMYVVQHGVSPATNELLEIIRDTRESTFLPIARPIPEASAVKDSRPSTPVTAAKVKSAAFGVEEEQESNEEEFLFGTVDEDEF